MNVIIFGATGGIGKWVVKYALDKDKTSLYWKSKSWIWRCKNEVCHFQRRYWSLHG